MSRNRRNNHYHFAEQYEKRTRRVRVREVLRLPKRSAIFALLVLFAFGLISTTFAAYVTNAVDAYAGESDKGIIMQIRNKKVQDDTLAGVGANADLAATGAGPYTIYMIPKSDMADVGTTYRLNYKNTNDTWGQASFSFTGRTYGGRPVYSTTFSPATSASYNCQLQVGTGGSFSWDLYAGSHNWSDWNGKYFDANDSGTWSSSITFDTYKLYTGSNTGATSNTDLGSFTDFSSKKYTKTVRLTGGTQYKFYLYNSSYGYGNKTFRADAAAVTVGATAGSNSSNMYAYNTASSNVFPYTPTYTGNYTFTWELTDSQNADSKVHIAQGSLKIDNPNFYSVEIAQSTDKGTVVPASKTYVQSGSSQSVTITPDNGFLINTVTKNSGTNVTWTQEQASGYIGTVTPTANTKYTVTYTEVLKTVTFNTNKPGTVAISSGQAAPANNNYAATKTASVGVDTGTYVFAKPQTGFSFTSWSQSPASSLNLSGDAAVTDGIRRVYVQGNGSDSPATLTANFALNNPTLSAFSYSAAYTFTGVPLSCTTTATSATGTHTGITYSYSLPGGTTGASVDSDGTFTATEPGTYTVTAQATDTVTVSGSTFTATSSARTQTITVYPSPNVRITAEPGDTSTITGTGTSSDPYIFVIRQPIIAKATLLGDYDEDEDETDYHRDIFTYTWSTDGENWDEDPTDPDTDEYTNIYQVTNVDPDPPHQPNRYFSTMAAITGQSFTVYCRANLTANTDIEIIVPVTFSYNVSSEILRIDDFYFMEDKGTGSKVKYNTQHQKIYPENSAGLAADITYGGEEFNHYIYFNKDRSANYTEIYNEQAVAILNQFFNALPGHENDPGGVNDVYLNYTAKPGVKSFKIKVEDTRAASTLYAEAGPLNTVVGTRSLSGSKPIYFKTTSSLTNVRNIVLFYYKDGEWYFQNGQMITAGYYRFNVPSDVTGVFFGAAKSGIYGLPTLTSNGDVGSIAFSATDYVAWSASQVNLSTGNPKFTGVISGTSITGSFGPL